MRKLALALLLLATWPALAQIQRFPFPKRATYPIDLYVAPDGRMWVGGVGLWRIDTSGAMTLFPDAGLNFSRDVLLLAGGALWYGPDLTGLSRLDPETGASSLHLFPAEARASLVFAGTDGNLWVARGGGHDVLRITTAGQIIATYQPAAAGLRDAALGPDGALWIVAGQFVVRMTNDGQITSYPMPFAAEVIEAGPDALWIVTRTEVARVDLNGQVTRRRSITVGSVPLIPVAVDSTGNLWIATHADRLARITPAGSVMVYGLRLPPPDPCAYSFGSWDMEFAPDRALWLVEEHFRTIHPPPGCGPEPTADDYLTLVDTAALQPWPLPPLPPDPAVPALSTALLAVLAAALGIAAALRLRG